MEYWWSTLTLLCRLQNTIDCPSYWISPPSESNYWNPEWCPITSLSDIISLPSWDSDAVEQQTCLSGNCLEIHILPHPPKDQNDPIRPTTNQLTDFYVDACVMIRSADPNQDHLISTDGIDWKSMMSLPQIPKDKNPHGVRKFWLWNISKIKHSQK